MSRGAVLANLGKFGDMSPFCFSNQQTHDNFEIRHGGYVCPDFTQIYSYSKDTYSFLAMLFCTDSKIPHIDQFAKYVRKMAPNILSNGNSSSSHPSPYYHEYSPDLDKDLTATQSYLKGKPHIKTARKIRIVAIGAAASSLAFAREVREGRIQNASLVLYEKNPGIGGTWFENK
jgi:hypothetical protein